MKENLAKIYISGWAETKDAIRQYEDDEGALREYLIDRGEIRNKSFLPHAMYRCINFSLGCISDGVYWIDAFVYILDKEGVIRVTDERYEFENLAAALFGSAEKED